MVVFFSTNIGGFFHPVRDSTETKKIQMDPTRDSANPYVGLAFKLEVIQFDLVIFPFLHVCAIEILQFVMFCYFLSFRPGGLVS